MASGLGMAIPWFSGCRGDVLEIVVGDCPVETKGARVAHLWEAAETASAAEAIEVDLRVCGGPQVAGQSSGGFGPEIIASRRVTVEPAEEERPVFQDLILTVRAPEALVFGCDMTRWLHVEVVAEVQDSLTPVVSLRMEDLTVERADISTSAFDIFGDAVDPEGTIQLDSVIASGDVNVGVAMFPHQREESVEVSNSAFGGTLTISGRSITFDQSELGCGLQAFRDVSLSPGHWLDGSGGGFLVSDIELVGDDNCPRWISTWGFPQVELIGLSQSAEAAARGVEVTISDASDVALSDMTLTGTLSINDATAASLHEIRIDGGGIIAQETPSLHLDAVEASGPATPLVLCPPTGIPGVLLAHRSEILSQDPTASDASFCVDGAGDVGIQLPDGPIDWSCVTFNGALDCSGAEE